MITWTHQPSAKMLVIIIEDDPDITKLLKFRIEKMGYYVISVSRGLEGLEFIRRLKPELVLLDLSLPDINGEEICKTIRESTDAHISRTPIIMITAKSSEADRIVGKVIGANVYMTKPIEMNDLKQNIELFVCHPEQSEGSERI